MTRFIVLTVVFAGPTVARADTPKELAPFQGEWKVIKVTVGGKNAPDNEVAALRFAFAGDKLTTSEGGKEQKPVSVSVNPKPDPGEIDIMNAKGEKVHGVYKFGKDGRLTMCFAQEPGAARPKGFDAGADVMVVVLEKAKK